MGELYLDNVERAAIKPGTGWASLGNRPARRFVADPNSRPRCTSCGKTASRPRVVNGKTCCAVHVPGADSAGPTGELMTTLEGWFGHRHDPAETVG